MANESAIIVPVAEVEPIVGPLRLRYDKSALFGVPAHITLLIPFHPPLIAEAEIADLAEFFSTVPAFEFSFIEVRRFPQTAYLHPDRAPRFKTIITKLLERWPECGPYNGAFPDIVPHLTVADQVDAQILHEVQDLLSDHLPINCIAKEAWLLFSNDSGFWSRRTCFPLGTLAGKH